MTTLDETLTTPVRLRICSYLAGCEEADFAAVQEFCAMTASSLSKQVTVLLERGYLDLRKVPSGRYTKTRLRLTEAGRHALASHVDSLRLIASSATAAAQDAT